MQGVIQKMLHSDHGVPIRSHKRRLISAIPSAFTGTYVHVVFTIFLVFCLVGCNYYNVPAELSLNFEELHAHVLSVCLL